jgi:sensor histidine kinase YesM
MLNYSSYLRNYSQTHWHDVKPNAYKLPISKISFSGNSSHQAWEREIQREDNFCKTIQNGTVQTFARSPFAALSCGGDLFKGPEEVERNVHASIFVFVSFPFVSLFSVLMFFSFFFVVFAFVFVVFVFSFFRFFVFSFFRFFVFSFFRFFVFSFFRFFVFSFFRFCFYFRLLPFFILFLVIFMCFKKSKYHKKYVYVFSLPTQEMIVEPYAVPIAPHDIDAKVNPFFLWFYQRDVPFMDLVAEYLIALFCFVLFFFVLFCFVLFCFVLFCFVLFYFVVFCFVLFCFALLCFVLFSLV